MLSEYQRNIILFNIQQNNSIEYIQNLEQLKSKNGKKIRRDKLMYWIDRINQTGSCEPKKKKGRPSVISINKRNKILSAIKEDDEITYPELVRKFKLNCSPKTVNNLALKNGISKFLIILYIIFQ